MPPTYNETLSDQLNGFELHYVCHDQASSLSLAKGRRCFVDNIPLAQSQPHYTDYD